MRTWDPWGGTRGARGHTWQGQGWGRSKRGHKNQGEDAAKGLRAWRRGRSDREAELVAGFKRKIWGGERGEESGFKETFWKQPRSLYNQEYRSREHRGCFFRRIQSSAVLKQLGGTVAAGLGPRRPSPDFRMGSVLQDVLPQHQRGGGRPPACPLSPAATARGTLQERGVLGFGGLSCSSLGASKPQGPGGSRDWSSRVLPCPDVTAASPPRRLLLIEGWGCSGVVRGRGEGRGRISCPPPVAQRADTDRTRSYRCF